MGKSGKYGSEKVWESEKDSEFCAYEIYKYLVLNHPIKGWTYRLLTNGLREIMYYKREDVFVPYPIKNSIKPDVPAIILIEDNNPNNFYLVLSGEDKYQKTKGNAIERVGKNFIVMYQKICYNTEICPYVIFCSGEAFINNENKIETYINSKIRQTLPYTWDGKPYFWDPLLIPHGYKKSAWNLVYIQRSHFSREQKYEILKNVAEESVKFYKDILKNGSC